MNLQKNISPQAASVCEILTSAGYQAYLVGGCVRDLVLCKNPKDWDITTNATPEQILSCFQSAGKRVVYENNFGTVAIIHDDLQPDDPSHTIEVTPFRIEGEYSNQRHPDVVTFANTLDEDLSRRDFTINAMAYDLATNTLIDKFGGQQDLKDGLIRAVGDPDMRFSEDALRTLRAVRLMSEFGFVGETETIAAISKHAPRILNISAERVSTEFLRIVDAPHAIDGMIALQKFGLLEHFIPEFLEGIGCEQNQAHAYDVWKHLLKTMEHGTVSGFPFHVKLAGLLHDIGKPRTRDWSDKKGDYTFYNHEVVGATMSYEILERLRVPRNIARPVVKLVRHHMFFSDSDVITLAGVRRMIARVGIDLVWDLIDLRKCDRIGTGRPKEQPYRLRKFVSMVEESMRDPVSVKMLKIDGKKIMTLLNEPPGPRIGLVLSSLLGEVLEDPQKNTQEYLQSRATQLAKLPNDQLTKNAELGNIRRDEEDERELSQIRKKYAVR